MPEMIYQSQFDFPVPEEKDPKFDTFPVVPPVDGEWTSVFDSYFVAPQQPQDATPSFSTVSPAELLSTTSTVTNCFSDVDHTPLIETTDFAQDVSTWTPLFEPIDEVSEHANAVQLDSTQETVGKAAPVQPPASQQHPSAAPGEQSPPSFAKALAAEVERKLKRKSARSSSHKVDAMGITVYNRKPRSLPLRPVEVSETADSATAKRARNTEAARRSRARKMERMVQLEERVHELLHEKEELESEVRRLKAKCGEI